MLKTNIATNLLKGRDFLKTNISTNFHILTMILRAATMRKRVTKKIDDDTTVTVRMAREKAILFTPLFEGSCEFKAVIPLAKV